MMFGHRLNVLMMANMLHVRIVGRNIVLCGSPSELRKHLHLLHPSASNAQSSAVDPQTKPLHAVAYWSDEGRQPIVRCAAFSKWTEWTLAMTFSGYDDSNINIVLGLLLLLLSRVQHNTCCGDSGTSLGMVSCQAGLQQQFSWGQLNPISQRVKHGWVAL